MSQSKLFPAGGGATLAVIFALAVSPFPAHAGDPIFPPGSRVGLIPPPGMAVSHSFAGFADPKENAAILITTLPAAAYAKVNKTLDAVALKKQGVSIEKREPIQLSAGKGYLLVGRQVAGKDHYRKWLLVAAVGDLTALVSVQVPEHDKAYPDSALRAALASLSVRASVPLEEQLRLLPFTIGNLAGFRVEGVLPGRAIVLGDVPTGSSGAAQNEKSKGASKEASKVPSERTVDARMLVAAVPGGPSEFGDRANFARLLFNEIPEIQDIQLTEAGPLRIGNQMGYQTMAQAKDVHGGGDVMVVQWLLFGSGGYLRMTAVAPAKNWTSTLARLRAVRDSVKLRGAE